MDLPQNEFIRTLESLPQIAFGHTSYYYFGLAEDPESLGKTHQKVFFLVVEPLRKTPLNHQEKKFYDIPIFFFFVL